MNLEDSKNNQVENKDELEKKENVLNEHKSNTNSNNNKGKKLTEINDKYTIPENFSMVVGSIYRSSFPRVEHFEFLQRLNLKSILTLIPEEYPIESIDFMEKNNIKFFQIGMPGNKEPFVNVTNDAINKALYIVLDPKNHPLLIHCNRGKHRTGCVVGCVRKLQNWSQTMIFDEYRRFAHPKARALDQQLIELFDERDIMEFLLAEGKLPVAWNTYTDLNTKDKSL